MFVNKNSQISNLYNVKTISFIFLVSWIINCLALLYFCLPIINAERANNSVSAFTMIIILIFLLNLFFILVSVLTMICKELTKTLLIITIVISIHLSSSILITLFISPFITLLSKSFSGLTVFFIIDYTLCTLYSIFNIWILSNGHQTSNINIIKENS